MNLEELELKNLTLQNQGGQTNEKKKKGQNISNGEIDFDDDDDEEDLFNDDGELFSDDNDNNNINNK